MKLRGRLHVYHGVVNAITEYREGLIGDLLVEGFQILVALLLDFSDVLFDQDQ